MRTEPMGCICNDCSDGTTPYITCATCGASGDGENTFIHNQSCIYEERKSELWKTWFEAELAKYGTHVEERAARQAEREAAHATRVFKTKDCWFYKAGRCTKGNKCTFIHGEPKKVQ